MVFGLFRGGPAQQQQQLQQSSPAGAGAVSTAHRADPLAEVADASEPPALNAGPPASAPPNDAALGGLLGQASALGAEGLSLGAAAPERKALGPLPYTLSNKKMQARLADRQTAAVDMNVSVDAPADVLFDLLADPFKHEAIFDSIQSADAELLSEEGPRRKWRLDYVAAWRFWKVGGVCQNRLWMETDRDRGTVSFRLREPGFLRTYEGTWTITGPSGAGPNTLSPLPSPSPSLSAASSSSSLADSGSNHAGASPPASPGKPHGHRAHGLFASVNHPFVSTLQGALQGGGSSAGSCAPSAPPLPRSPTRITVTKTMSPRISPPFPLNHTLKAQASSQVDDMLSGLLLATAKTIDGTFGAKA